MDLMDREAVRSYKILMDMRYIVQCRQSVRKTIFFMKDHVDISMSCTVQSRPQSYIKYLGDLVTPTDTFLIVGHEPNL
jgi:phosphohistidine phosphatase SixA